MCGFAGIVSLTGRKLNNPKQSAKVFSHLLAHRGPDDEGSWLSPNGNCLLTFRRLSILDLSNAGAQPMQGENKTIIVQNGEIYNYKEIRRRYSTRDWKSESDTESILAAYENKGFDCVDQLRGMFGFGIVG